MVDYLRSDIRYNTDELQQLRTVVLRHICMFLLKLLTVGWSYEHTV